MDDYEENYPGEQSSWRKILSNRWSAIIKWSTEVGNNHFAITINIPQFCRGDGSDPEVMKNFQKLVSIILARGFPTITWHLFVIEKNKNGNIHFHMTVAIRNFVDYNYTLKNNIIEIIIKGLESYFFNIGHNIIGFIDVKVESLFYFKDIKNWIIYTHKDYIKWKYKASIHSIDKYYYNSDLDCFDGEMMDTYRYALEPNGMMMFLSYRSEDDNGKLIKVVDINTQLIEDLNGIRLTHNRVDQRTLINILQYYLILNNYYIYNDNIYMKIKDSKISYTLVGSITEVLYVKFQDNVVKYFIMNFNNYFRGFDFSYLTDTHFVKTKSVIESIKDISTQRIEPDFGLIELKDGIYSIKYNRFFYNKDNHKFNSSVATIKYYGMSYSSVKQKKPINWINGLKNALNIKSEEITNEDYVRLCLNIIYPIHKNMFDKQSTLFIYGKSNTGKTSLVTNIYNDYYGPDNSGSIVTTKNFKYQDLVGKLLGIIDEGRYNPSMSSDLLKITGREKIIVEKKYSKEHISIDPIPLIILTNTLFEDRDSQVDEALRNRLYIIEFINSISKDNLKNSNKFKEKIRGEEVNIIVYCNKLLFGLQENNFKKIGSRISNKNIIKMIENKK